MASVVCPVPSVDWEINDNPDSVAREVSWTVPLCCPDHEDDLRNTRPDLIAAAVDAMFEATCRQYGVCDLTVRPCIPMCECNTSICVSNCDYRKLDLANFTFLPIVSVSEVKVSGAVVAPGDYRVSGNRHLIPHRDGALWDCPEQDLNRPDDHEDSWSITMQVGKEPPPLVLAAAGELACQLYLFCTDQPCDLPPNAVSVTRDGVTVHLDTGLDAIPSVKMARQVYGDCKKKRRRSRLVDPRDFRVFTS